MHYNYVNAKSADIDKSSTYRQQIDIHHKGVSIMGGLGQSAELRHHLQPPLLQQPLSHTIFREKEDGKMYFYSRFHYSYKQKCLQQITTLTNKQN